MQTVSISHRTQHYLIVSKTSLLHFCHVQHDLTIQSNHSSHNTHVDMHLNGVLLHPILLNVRPVQYQKRLSQQP